MNRIDVTLMSLVVGMFISLLVFAAGVGYFAYKVTGVDYKSELIAEDYNRKINAQSKDFDVRYNRLMEQVSTLQFTSEKRIHLLEEQLSMYRNEKQRCLAP